MNDKDLQVQHLADRLGDLARPGLGARSLWALQAALDAAEAEGIAGLLVINIPAKCRDFLEVSFTIGTVEVVSRWGG